MSKLVDNDNEYALLVASVQTTGERPLSPIQTSASVERLVNEEGIEEAGLLLSIGKDMINYFIRLNHRFWYFAKVIQLPYFNFIILIHFALLIYIILFILPN